MQHSQRNNYVTQLAILLVLFGTGLIAVQFLFLALASVLHLSATSLLTGSPAIARLTQSVGALFTLGLPAFVFAWVVKPRQPIQYLRFTSRISGKQFFLVILIVLSAIIMGGALAKLTQQLPLPVKWTNWFKKLEDNYNSDILIIANLKTVKDYLLSLLLLAFLPALMEEMLFRGCLQQVLTGMTKKPWLGILLTATLFSAVHLSFYGFLPRLFLGMVLGYLFYYSDNLWLSIWAHFFNNALALSSVYRLSREGKLTPENINDSMNDTFPLYLGLMGLAATVALLLSFRKESEALAASYNNEQEPYNNTDQ